MTGLRDTYLFDESRRDEQHRCLAAALDPVSTGRLAATGVADGWHCLDVGCGSGSLARWLAQRVAPTGCVVATDVAPVPVSDSANLSVVEHDIRTDPLEGGAFDLVVVRMLLQHLPERDALVAKLGRALKPGGWLQVDELDASYEPVLLAPDARSAELCEKFLRAKRDAMCAAGGDPEWGRSAAASLRAAGFVDVDPQPHVGSRNPGSPDLELQENHTHHLRDALVAAGMTDEELAQVRAAMRDPSFRSSSGIVYSVQGRKP